MINKIAKRLLLMRMAEITTNGLNEGDIIFKPEMVQALAGATWKIIDDTQAKAQLRELFLKKYEVYRKQNNLTDEKYELPNAPGFRIANKMITKELCNKLIMDLKTTKQNKMIPYNLFKSKYPDVYSYATRVWLEEKTYTVLSKKKIINNLNDLHSGDDEYITNDTGALAEWDPPKGRSTRSHRLGIKQQIEAFLTIDKVVWDYVKQQFQRKVFNGSSEFRLQNIIGKGNQGWITDDDFKAGKDHGDPRVWDRGLAEHKRVMKVRDDLCAKIPEIWNQYDALIQYDPKKQYTFDKINALKDLLKNNKSNPVFYYDIFGRLLKDKSILDRLADELQSTLMDENDDVAALKIAKERDNDPSYSKILDPRSNYELSQQLCTMFSNKVKEYQNKIREFLTAYKADHKDDKNVDDSDMNIANELGENYIADTDAENMRDENDARESTVQFETSRSMSRLRQLQDADSEDEEAQKGKINTEGNYQEEDDDDMDNLFRNYKA